MDEEIPEGEDRDESDYEDDFEESGHKPKTPVIQQKAPEPP